jgi:hypothetical protein
MVQSVKVGTHFAYNLINKGRISASHPIISGLIGSLSQIHHSREQVHFRPDRVENEVGIDEHVVGRSQSRVRSEE